MNSYLYQYVVKRLDENLFSEIEEILSNHTGYEESKVENFNGNTFDPNNQDLTRKSKVCFVDNHDLYNIIWEQVDEVNSNSMWNFDVDYMEPLQIRYIIRAIIMNGTLTKQTGRLKKETMVELEKLVLPSV